MYVQVPSVSFGSTSEKAYGTLEIAEMPAPEYSISTTPKLFMITASTSAASPLKVILLSIPFSRPFHILNLHFKFLDNRFENVLFLYPFQLGDMRRLQMRRLRFGRAPTLRQQDRVRVSRAQIVIIPQSAILAAGLLQYPRRRACGFNLYVTRSIISFISRRLSATPMSCQAQNCGSAAPPL